MIRPPSGPEIVVRLVAALVLAAALALLIEQALQRFTRWYRS